MTASASLKRKPCSKFSNLSTLTRKALQADLRQCITDERPVIDRQAAERQGAAQRIWRFPTVLARTLRRSKTRAWGEYCGGIERADVTRRVTPGGECRTVASQGPGNAVFWVCGPLVDVKVLCVLRCGKTAPASTTA